jgi:hypothetical protein
MTFITKSYLKALLTAQEDGMPGVELPAFEYIVDDEAGPVEVDSGPECLH